MDLESRILDLAVRRGLLRQDAAAVHPSADPDKAAGPSARLQALVEAGALSPEVLEALRWEAERSPGASLEASPACPDSWVADSALEAPRQLAPAPEPAPTERYRELALLGTGGAGQVYRAFDALLRREVALKFPRFEGERQRERWLREAQAQAQVNHPNVCKVFEVGESQGQPFIAMELVPGRTLAQAAAGLDLRGKVRILRDVAEAVHAAHRAGLLHLDLKPGNVLMAQKAEGGWHPMVADFGFHREEGAGEDPRPPLGTPPFSSPEQLRGGPVDRRSDIYALGMSLYVLLAGALPYASADPEAQRRLALERAPRPLAELAPELPSDLVAVVEKCLAPAPKDRYNSALALAEDLQRFLDGEPVRALKATVAYRLRKWAARHRALAWVSAASLAAVLGAGLWSGLAVLRTRRLALRVQEQQRWSREMELRLDRARSAPLHDLRPLLGWIEQQVRAKEEEAQGMDPELRAATAFAVAQVQWAMRHPLAAEESLHRSWDGGYRRPETSVLLGLAMMHRYLLEAGRARLLPDPGLRGKAVQRLDAEIRKPALRYLAPGHNEGGVRALYAEAGEALLEGRHEQAMAVGRRMIADEEWDTTGYLLCAEASMGLAEEKAVGDPAAADAAWEQARTLLEKAADVDRSDPRLYHELALMYLRRYTGKSQIIDPAAPWVAAAQKAIEQGLQADPRLGGLHAVRATLTLAIAIGQVGRGQDPRDSFRIAGESADRALAESADDNGSLDSMTLGRMEALNAKAELLNLESAFYSRAGQDVRLKEEEALRLFAQAAELQPDSPAPHAGMCRAALQQGYSELDQGRDPRPDFERSYQEAARAADLVPSQPGKAGLLLVIANKLIDEDLTEHEDPTRHLALAQAALERTRGAVDHQPIFLMHQAELKRNQALWAARQGQDPAPLMAAAEAFGDQALQLLPRQPDIMMEHGLLQLQGIKLNLKEPAQARRYLAQANAAFEAMQKAAPPGDLNPLMALGHVGRWAAELQPGSPWIARGEKDLREVIAKAPQVQEAKALLAVLLLRSGRAEEGRVLLKATLDRSPRLKPEYGAYLD